MTVEVPEPMRPRPPRCRPCSGDIRSPVEDVAEPKSHGYSEHLDSYGASEAGGRDDRYPFARRRAGDVSSRASRRGGKLSTRPSQLCTALVDRNDVRPERGRCEVDDNGAGSPADIIVSPVGVVATPSALRASGRPIPDRCRRTLHFENERKAQ